MIEFQRQILRLLLRRLRNSLGRTEIESLSMGVSVFCIVVVQLPGIADFDKRKRLSVQDSDRCLHSVDILFHERRTAVAEGEFQSGGPFSLRTDQGKSERGSLLRRLDNQRESELGRTGSVQRIHHHAFRIPDPALIHDFFAGDLVHDRPTGKRSGSDELQTGVFQHLLKGSILAESAVQHGIDHIGGAHFLRHLQFRNIVFPDLVSAFSKRGGHSGARFQGDRPFRAGSSF